MPDPEELPNKDVRVTEAFLQERSALLGFVARTLTDIVLGTPGAVDSDAREALDAIVQTCRTLESGLVYQTRPSNLVAARIQQQFDEALREYEQRLRERLGMETIRNADLIGVMVFLQRLAFAHDNGRKRGRAFVDLLRKSFPATAAPGTSPLLLP